MGLCIVIALIAYAIGSVNFSVIISRKFAGIDIRDKGSGNAGTTNMLRNLGVKPAVITLVCDILKGVLAVLIAFIVRKNCKSRKYCFTNANSRNCSNNTDILFQYFLNSKVVKVLRQH